MQTEILFILVKKLFFGLTVGGGFFTVALFSKPMLERSVLNQKFNDDAYYWGEIVIAIILALIAMVLV
jgi:hypothetical protein